MHKQATIESAICNKQTAREGERIRSDSRCVRVCVLVQREGKVVLQGSTLRRVSISSSEQRDESRSKVRSSIPTQRAASVAEGEKGSCTELRYADAVRVCCRSDQKNTHKYHRLTKCHASTIYQHVKMPPRKCAKISNPLSAT